MSRILQIGGLAKAFQQMAIWHQDNTLIAAAQGHVKGTPLSPRAVALLKKSYQDAYNVLQDIEDAAPGLSLVWHPLPPPK